MAMWKVPVTSDDHIQGVENASVTLLEYGDYECPYCGRAYSVIKKLQEHYGQQLRFVFRNFPLSQIHPYAEPAAEAAEFASAHGRFWEMHDDIYENQSRLGMPLLLELAELRGLSATALRTALANHEYLPKIRQDFLGGVRSGVNGTPAFFINGVRHDEAYEYEDLLSAIDAQLLKRNRRSA
jgi:protein-disulfide isomerase